MELETKTQPRPIEFMTKGHSVGTMMEILKKWDSISDEEKVELGFKDYVISDSQETLKSHLD